MLYRDLLENSEVSVTRVKKIEEWAILNPLCAPIGSSDSLRIREGTSCVVSYLGGRDV